MAVNSSLQPRVEQLYPGTSTPFYGFKWYFTNTIIFEVLRCKTNREQWILSLPVSFDMILKRCWLSILQSRYLIVRPSVLLLVTTKDMLEKTAKGREM